MSPWDTILSLDSGGAPRRSWEVLGPSLAPFTPLLKRTGGVARYINCDRCGCFHERVTEDDSAKIVAVCRCETATCEDMVLDRDSGRLVALDGTKLSSVLCDALPATVRAEQVGVTPAWHVGEATLRADGEAIAVVACFSGNGSAMRNAALAVSTEKLGRTVFVCKSGKPREIEALLPDDSRVVVFDDVWTVNGDGFAPGKSARRLFSGWEDEPLFPTATATPVVGYYFERRGQKKTKVGNEPYDLPLWRCCMDGRSFDLPDIVGSELLVRILLRRGDTIYADALMRGLTGDSVDVAAKNELEWIGDDEQQAGSTRSSLDARQELLDTKDIIQLQSKMRGLKSQIDGCGDDPALAGERAELQERLDEHLEYMSKNTRPGPNGTLLPKCFDDSLSSAGNLVGKHMRAVLKQLRGIDEALWGHLSNKDILRHGQTCVYDAEAGYPWQKK